MLVSASVYAQNDSVYFAAYPNPFQQQLHIAIDSLDSDTVSLDMLDVTGRTVKQFVNGLVLSNGISLLYDGDTLQEGVYFLRLQINGESRVLKIIKINNIGLQEQEGLATAEVFPNPAWEKVTIRFGEWVGEEIQITDLQGKVILSRAVEGELMELDIPHLKAGHYLIHLIKGADRSVRHLIRL